MTCHLCKRYQWEHSQPSVFQDSDGNEFCEFHAPKDDKKLSSEEFNIMVFEYIKKLPHTSFCNLGGTVFPSAISFSNKFSDISTRTKGKLPSISFWGGIFWGETTFSEIQFSDHTGFIEVEFKDQVSFKEAIFDNEAYFMGSTFHKEATFIGAIFNKDVVFNDSVFKEKAIFRSTSYKQIGHFTAVHFSAPSPFFGSNTTDNCIRFHSVPQRTLEMLCFDSMETHFFSFKGSEWPQKLHQEIRLGQSTTHKYEYQKTNQETSGLQRERNKSQYTYRNLEDLYRSLKHKADSEHDRPMVSRWHYREKLARLKHKMCNSKAIGILDRIDENHFPLSPPNFLKSVTTMCRLWLDLVRTTPKQLFLSVTGLYWMTSGFGEKPVRAFWWLILLLLAALMSSIIFSNDSDIIKTWFSCIPLVRTNTKLTNVSNTQLFFSAIFQITISIQATQLGFSLRNMFRR